MRAVPFIRPLDAYDELQPDIDAAIRGVLHGGQYVLGHAVESFEHNWAAFCGAAHAVGVSDGLAALTLALRALAIEPGDEVLVPSNTFIATWLAVSACGGVPVPVEPDPRTGLVTAEGIEARITSRTRVVVPVHLYGMPADLGAIGRTAAHHGLHVIEDAAQAHGARYQDVRIGGHSSIVCWSFYPTKNLGAIGDGGAITTRDAALAERLRLLRNYGSAEKYVHPVKGVNSRLDPIQAAILDAKLPHLAEWNERRAALAARYCAQLGDLPLALPRVGAGDTSSWHLFVVRSPQRDALRQHLAAAGIECLVHYPIPPHLQGAYAELGLGLGDLPVAEAIAVESLSLPIGPHLSEDDVDYVCDSIRQFHLQ